MIAGRLNLRRCWGPAERLKSQPFLVHDMASKRIILLLDGTWNDADIGPCETNIVRLRDLITKTLAHQANEESTLVPDSEVVSGSYGTKIVSGFTAAGLENFVFYERGVGTGFLDQFRGGIFGAARQYSASL